MRLWLLPQTFAICRLGPADPIPAALQAISPVSVTRTAEELSIVCPADAVPEGVRAETGWRCWKVRGPLPFSMTGVLASIAVPLAGAGIPILAISTFDTDYVLVPEARTSAASEALRAAGHELDDDQRE